MDVPDKALVKRLAQMKRIAEAVSVVDAWTTDILTPTEDYVLRMLPHPIHRYSSEKHGIADGAIFAFGQGTNPEAIVQTEAIKTDHGMRWRCAVSRMTGHMAPHLQPGDVLDAKSITDERPTQRKLLEPTDAVYRPQIIDDFGIGSYSDLRDLIGR